MKTLPLMKGTKQLCRYLAIEIKTGNVLVAGYKYKDFTRMQPTQQIREFPCFWRKIKLYEKIKLIKDNLCYVMFWAGSPAEEICSLVYPAGIKNGLYGIYYTEEQDNYKSLIDLMNLPKVE